MPFGTLWLPVLVSAGAVWLASAIIHMVLPHHKSDFKGPPDEGSAADALRKQKLAPGQYVMIAGQHHLSLPGLPLLVNLRQRDDSKMAQVQVLVGHFMLHEERGPGLGNRNQRALPGFGYVTPWPLSRDFYLISDLRNLLLLDRWGNVVPLYCVGRAGVCMQPAAVAAQTGAARDHHGHVARRARRPARPSPRDHRRAERL